MEASFHPPSPRTKKHNPNSARSGRAPGRGGRKEHVWGAHRSARHFGPHSAATCRWFLSVCCLILPVLLSLPPAPRSAFLPTPLPVPGNLLHFEYLLTFQEPRDHFYTQRQHLLKYLTLCWKQERMGVEDHPGRLESQAAQPVSWNLPLVGEAWLSLQGGRGSRSLLCRILACSWPWPWRLRAAADPHSTFVRSPKMPFLR